MGLGHIPSKKNNKFLTRGRLITNPKNQVWIEKCAQLMQSQLMSLSATTEGGTSTTQQQLYSILSCLPDNDCFPSVKKLVIEGIKVQKGMEGAIITITKLTD